MLLDLHTWRNRLGYQAHTGLNSPSVCRAVRLSVCLEYENTQNLNVGINIRVSTCSFLCVICPLRIPIPMQEENLGSTRKFVEIYLIPPAGYLGKYTAHNDTLKKNFVQEENLGSTRKFVENYLLFTCITNKILALHPWSVGWRNFFQIRQWKKSSSSPHAASVMRQSRWDLCSSNQWSGGST